MAYRRSKHNKRRTHSKRKDYPKKQDSHFDDSNRCAFCGGSLEGLPHKCRYCGKTNCSNHLLPEDHNCKGINTERKFGFKPIHFTPKETYTERSSNFRSHRPRFQQNSYRPRRPSCRMPRMNFPRIGPFFVALIVAIASYVLAVKFIENSLFLWIEFFAFAYLTILIYRKPFKWANRVSMADDLSFFGLRILGGIVVVVGFYIGFAVLFASFFVKGSAPAAIPLSCLLFGLVALGVFIAFRTNRRHQVVGFWRA